MAGGGGGGGGGGAPAPPTTTDPDSTAAALAAAAEEAGAALAAAEAASVGAYVDEADNLEALHDQVSEWRAYGWAFFFPSLSVLPSSLFPPSIHTPPKNPKKNQQILECDAGLAGLESTLASFQAGLGGLSTDIRGLQARTARLAGRLANRKAAGAALGLSLIHI